MRHGDGTHRTNELSRVFLNTTLSPFTLVRAVSAARSCLPRRLPRQYPWAPRMHWLATHWLISLLHIALVAELETYDGQVGYWTGFDQVPT